MADHPTSLPITVTPFTWGDWTALWTIRLMQLAEHGIQIDPTTLPDRPQPDTDHLHEWDFHHLDHVYLRGAGHFWIARCADQPIGYVGGQDLGGAIELRRMYVNAFYRRRGIGSTLVQALIDRSRAYAIPAIELCTAAEGPGRQLYQTFGFQVMAGPGAEYADVIGCTRYTPGDDEIRMRMELWQR
jgi:GNAT superfamily N-acetyltransferase